MAKKNSRSSSKGMPRLEKTVLTPGQRRFIENNDALAEHESYGVWRDPETGDVWAACWVRMPKA